MVDRLFVTFKVTGEGEAGTPWITLVPLIRAEIRRRHAALSGRPATPGVPHRHLVLQLAGLPRVRNSLGRVGETACGERADEEYDRNHHTLLTAMATCPACQATRKARDAAIDVEGERCG